MAIHIVARNRRKQEGEKYIYPSYKSGPAKLQISVRTVGKPRSHVFTLRLPKLLGMDVLLAYRELIIAHVQNPESTLETLAALFGDAKAKLKAEALAIRNA